jgi:hypothetical protein
MFDFGVLRQLWNAVNDAGGCDQFSQANYLDDPSYKSPNLNVQNGICRAWCQKFVDLRMLAYEPRIMGMKLREHLLKTARRQTSPDWTDISRTDLGFSAPQKEWKGGLVFKSVDGPKSLAEKMLKQGALTVFSISPALSGSGHDIAYDSRGGAVHFFDANCGYYYAPAPNLTALADFLKAVWEQGQYKQIGRVHYRKIYSV